MQKKSKLILPFAPVEKLMRENTNLKISAKSTEALTEELILRGKKISELAWKIAQNSGRKTVVDKDIKLAYEQLHK